MKLLDFFERLYIINLPTRPDRLKSIVYELERIGLSLESDRVELFSGITPEDAGNFPSPGIHGCFLSHLNILKKAKEDNLSNVLIVEDDLLITKHFNRIESSLIQQLDDLDWHMVHFGFRLYPEMSYADYFSQPTVASISHRFKVKRNSFSFLGTHFYGVHGAIFEELIVFLEMIRHGVPGDSTRGPMPIDGAYNIFRMENPDLCSCLLLPSLGSQIGSRSDISPGKLDQFPLLNPLVDNMRLWKRHFVRLLA